ncbi:hypothetical protein AVEN_263618-1 [Araneus ventricosus]|uniref:Uncharacterized protein n=1 Tax=Araneus ventricosus TaxID=182803 RepID=A0A4Y2LYQ0_ARAVE|nr:hypothetical protein AVEN_263618-1 [Araneus ventricosus]
MTERFYNRQTLRFLNSREVIFIVFIRGHIGIHRVSTTIRTSQRMSLLDESRWKKHGERYATVITDDRGNASSVRLLMRDREQLLFAARVDIDVYDASGNIVHIAGKSEFPMLREKRQYKHRNGDDCITSILSDASKIGTVLTTSGSGLPETFSHTTSDVGWVNTQWVGKYSWGIFTQGWLF